MKSFSATLLVILLLSTFACGPKVNDPADVRAIKKMDALWDKPYSAGNAETLVSDNYSDKVVRFPQNEAAIAGKDAIRANFEKYFSQFSSEIHVVTEDVRVSGDLAVSRGTYEGKTSLKAGGFSIQEKGKWVTASERQADGSWKAFWDISTSDLPVADSLPVGEEEQVLLRIEREWGEADLKADIAALEKILSKDWVGSTDGEILKKAQFLAELKSGAIKFTALTPGNMRPIVFGDSAVVEGSDIEKSKIRGKDTSGKYQWVDTYRKRDGRWQCVASYATKAE
jgi:ketosteroid isomerase-like protein